MIGFKVIADRLKTAYKVVTKGTQWPFNIIGRNADSRMNDKMERPYEKSVWVSRAIKKVSNPIASVPLKFSQDGRQGEVDFEDDKLTQFWAKPAVGLSYFDFIEATVGWLSLAGEAFWLLDDTWVVPFPSQSDQSKIIFARPDRMKEIVEDNELMGWEYRDKANRRVALLKEQVIQLKYWNPYNDYRGLAPWLAAQCASEADWYACTFNRNLWKNNGDRGPIVVGKNGQPNADQQQQVIDQLRMKRSAAKNGDFKAIFISGDIEVQDPQVQTLDGNAVATRLQNRHEIALAFGVPPSMFDVVASYSIGSASDRFILIEETCMPLGEKISDHIEEVAKLMTGEDNLFAWFDWDEHSTMQQVRRERLVSADSLWSKGMPMQLVNDYLKLGMPEYEGWEVGYLPFGVAAVGEPVVNPFDPNDFSEDTEDDETEDEDQLDDDEDGSDDEMDDVQLALQTIRRGIEEHGGIPETPTNEEQGQEFQRDRPRRERQLWLSHMASRTKIIRAYQSKFNRVLMSFRSQVLSNLNSLFAATKGNGKMRKAIETEIIFDEQAFKRQLVISLNAVAGIALQESGEQLFREMEEMTGEHRDPWKTPPHEVLEFNRTRENKIVGVGSQVFQEINQTVEEGIRQGQSVDKLSSEIRSKFNDISKARGKRIALTETAAAYGQGRQSAIKASGAQYKQWLSSGLGNVRPAHRNANGQVKPVDQAFDVGGEALMHPGDPRGSAGNVINCHCVSVPTNNPNAGV